MVGTDKEYGTRGVTYVNPPAFRANSFHDILRLSFSDAPLVLFIFDRTKLFRWVAVNCKLVYEVVICKAKHTGLLLSSPGNKYC